MDPREENRINSLLLEPISEDNEIFSDGSEVEDNLEVSDHNTDTEQSEDEENPVPVRDVFPGRQPIPIFDVNRNTNYILGKDNLTRWFSCAPPISRNARRRPHNILRVHLPGPRRDAREARTPLDCWGLFFTDPMINTLVRYTNDRIAENRQHYERDRDAKDTDSIELKALLGLLYMAGTLKSSHQNLDDLYANDFTGVEFLRSTMSLRRLRFLLSSIRFDDANTRQERRQLDKLAPLREIFELFNENCLNNYTLGENVTIDEMLEPFRGRCPFRQYMKSKPAKYGIKVYALTDAKTYYASKMEVYCGKQQQGPFNISNKAKDVVLRLTQPIYQSGRNVTVDNYFCSIPLCDELASDYKLSLVGTLRKNKAELPHIVQEHTNRPIYSSLFFYDHDKTLLSYKAKKNKVVLLLSSLHNSDEIDAESGDAMKPEMLTFYNKTKGGVDTLDKLKAAYNVGRKTNRWPLALFFALMNIGAVNANIIYLANTQANIVRRHFLKTLAKELSMDHIRRRAVQENLPRQVKRQARKIAGIEDEDTRRPRAAGAAGRCAYCTWRENRKTVVTCSKCSRYICKQHTTSLCNNCAEDGNQDSSDEEA